MSAPGNSRIAAAAGAAGFTLLELLLVLAIVAMAAGGVAFSLRNLGQTQLEREAQRLIAMLESARARSRASGLPVYWHSTEHGFAFVGLPAPAHAMPQTGASALLWQPQMDWLGEGVSAHSAARVSLGPEPIIARQEIVLFQGGNQVRIATDGLRPFAVQPLAAPGPGS
jgi:general secretion pathway protein H